MRSPAVAVAVLVLSGCTVTGGEPEPSASPARPCGSGSPVSTSALPSWARAGFSSDGSGIKHVYGDRSEILAVLFGAPLVSPPAADRNNKILWVSREPPDTPAQLEIHAVLDGSTEQFSQRVPGGPGPSIVDLPKAGCWRLTLSWSGRTDTMDLIYQPNPSPSRAGPTRS